MAEPKPKEQFAFDAANFTVDAIRKADDEEQKGAERAMLKEAERRQSSRAAEKMVDSAIKMNESREKTQAKTRERTQLEIEDAKRKAIECKIKKYVQAFPALSQVIPRPSARASIPELEEIVAQIRDEIASQRSLHRVRNYASQALMLLETTWGDGSGAPSFVPAPMRLNLLGISKYYRMGAFESEIAPLLVEIDIEYPWLGRSNLVMRGMEAISLMCVKTNAINTNPEARALILGEAPAKAVNTEGL